MLGFAEVSHLSGRMVSFRTLEKKGRVRKEIEMATRFGGALMLRTQMPCCVWHGNAAGNVEKIKYTGDDCTVLKQACSCGLLLQSALMCCCGQSPSGCCARIRYRAAASIAFRSRHAPVTG